MRIAQQLYEGVDVGGGAVGLITYMRTDSVNLANEALDEIRGFVSERYGADHLPPRARIYKTKAKNAQEAHEAVRPTSIRRTPQELKAHLTSDQARLYELIWKRTLACQMAHALIDMVAVDLSAGEGNRFRATGSAVVSPGFMRVYLEGRDDAKGADDDQERMLPHLKEGELVDLEAIRPEQHFTEPPPRYTEASLVKALEEYGIGRPSTYASIISTLQGREYVELEKKRFHPTDVGRIVNRFLTEHFTAYVDYDFTARLEDELDAVSRGEEDWIPLLEQFWRPFKDRVDHTQENVKRSDVTQEVIEEACSQCGAPLSIHLGRHGRFIGCTKYPECDYTRDLADATRTERPPRGRRRPQVPGMRLRAAGEARQIRQIHRLRRLSQVPLYRIPGASAGHRRHLPQVRPGDPAEKKVAAGQDLLLVRHLSQMRLRGLEPAPRRALPPVRLAGAHPQDDQAGRDAQGLSPEGLWL